MFNFIAWYVVFICAFTVILFNEIEHDPTYEKPLATAIGASTVWPIYVADYIIDNSKLNERLRLKK